MAIGVPSNTINERNIFRGETSNIYMTKGSIFGDDVGNTVDASTYPKIFDVAVPEMINATSFAISFEHLMNALERYSSLDQMFPLMKVVFQ